MRRVFIWLKTLYYFLSSINCYKKSHILNIEDTINFVLNTKKSVIRLGDGEFNIIAGKDIMYQEYSDELKYELVDIIENYIHNSDNVNYILCMPGDFFKCNGIRLLKKRVYISSWSLSRYIFKKKYDRDVVYGDAFLFGKGNEIMYKKTWENSGIKNIIFVHNSELYGEKFENRYGIRTDSIIIPSKNSFDSRTQILGQIIESAKGKLDLLILISAGPCAKYLVKQLALNGFWAIDTGHCWDEPLSLMELNN